MESLPLPGCVPGLVVFIPGWGIKSACLYIIWTLKKSYSLQTRSYKKNKQNQPTSLNLAKDWRHNPWCVMSTPLTDWAHNPWCVISPSPEDWTHNSWYVMSPPPQGLNTWPMMCAISPTHTSFWLSNESDSLSSRTVWFHVCNGYWSQGQIRPAGHACRSMHQSAFCPCVLHQGIWLCPDV